eukprot:8522947-Heterocapsa_arctica.AAC.1
MYGCSVKPDLSYVVKELARKLAAPTVDDRKRMRQLLRYLRGSTNVVLKLNQHTRHDEKDILSVYADA